jgi:uncharacterized membrane protein (UPF0182 family)
MRQALAVAHDEFCQGNVMYIALLVLLFALGGSLIVNGVQRQRAKTLFVGSLIVLVTALFFSLLSFWGEMLWFEELDQSQRFWTTVFAQGGLAALGALVGGLGVFILTLPIPVQTSLARVWPALIGALSGALWGCWNWQIILKYAYRVSTEIRDPILQRDTGFYLFTLPFYDNVYWGLLWTAGIALAAAVYFALDARVLDKLPSEPSPFANSSVYGGQITPHRFFLLPMAAIAGVVAWGQYLNIYHLLYSKWGVVTGAGWTDVHVRLPAYLLVGAVTLLLGLSPLVPALYSGLTRQFRRRRRLAENAALIPLAAPWLGIFAIWFLVLGVAPVLVQWLRVQPNEITLEAPYIANNIEFTRRGFKLRNIEAKEFSVSPTFTQETLSNNQYLLSEVRLWDWRALEAVYKQFQEIRLYYEFTDVDVDRYQTARGYRQVMVSAREMALANLPPESRTFVNLRFKYTHGYGLTMAPVSDFTADGLPNLLIKDIPPRTDDEKLRVAQPQIYYGELTDSHVFVNTSESEFDYPKGDENAYVNYSGSGGVRITNLWRKFLVGWKFDGTRFLLSTYPTRESRVLFHREIRERVKTLAPFLKFDVDPYVVLVDGKLYWIIDAYTTSTYYPYSESFSSTEPMENMRTERGRGLAHGSTASLAGVNYVRNSVKAVVDAFNGSVTFYVFEPEDPLIQVWQRIFPALFTPRDKMPEGLRAHVRYPRDFLLVQGLVYAKYHMTDPAVFYNQEDLWMRATEKYYAAVQPVEPYYVMWQPPGLKNAEFILMLPFTPKNRQVMIGWIAGMCDPANYGRLLAYKFPKEERILGPQQVETKIDQDGFLSGQLSLWNQQGSRVIRGNTLVIPIDNSLLYVEPIYLQAEAAAYPELRLVAVMHGDNLSYAKTFDEALQGLLTPEGKKAPPMLPGGVSGEKIAVKELILQAKQAFDDYLRLQGEGRFVEAAKELTRLRQALQQLVDQHE